MAKNFFVIVVDVQTAGQDALEQIEPIVQEYFSLTKREAIMNAKEWRTFFSEEEATEKAKEDEVEVEKEAFFQRLAEGETLLWGLLPIGTQGSKHFQEIQTILTGFSGMYAGENEEDQEKIASKAINLPEFQGLTFN